MVGTAFIICYAMMMNISFFEIKKELYFLLTKILSKRRSEFIEDQEFSCLLFFGISAIKKIIVGSQMMTYDGKKVIDTLIISHNS
jgi:hypothetical protein